MNSISDANRWLGITATTTFGCIFMMALISRNLRCDAFQLSPTTHHNVRHCHRHHVCQSNNDHRGNSYNCWCSRTETKSGNRLSRMNIQLPLIKSTRLTLLPSSVELIGIHEQQHHGSSDIVVSLLPLPVVSTEAKSSYTIDTMNFSLSSSMTSSPIENSDIVVPIIVIVALTIGILANGWISRLLSGEQGLGSFLSDGSGYKKSKFQPLKSNDDRAVQGDDPLPWLRLPNLDFVEVAGQKKNPNQQSASNRNNIAITDTLIKTSLEAGNSNNIETTTPDTAIALEELELLRLLMQEQLLLGNVVKAEQLRMKLERLMKDNNIQFMTETEPFQ